MFAEQPQRRDNMEWPSFSSVTHFGRSVFYVASLLLMAHVAWRLVRIKEAGVRGEGGGQGEGEVKKNRRRKEKKMEIIDSNCKYLQLD